MYLWLLICCIINQNLLWLLCVLQFDWLSLFPCVCIHLKTFVKDLPETLTHSLRAARLNYKWLRLVPCSVNGSGATYHGLQGEWETFMKPIVWDCDELKMQELQIHNQPSGCATKNQHGSDLFLFVSHSGCVFVKTHCSWHACFLDKYFLPVVKDALISLFSSQCSFRYLDFEYRPMPRTNPKSLIKKPTTYIRYFSSCTFLVVWPGSG